VSESTVIVTGASGFIGANLVRHLRSRGWRVRALVRDIPAERLEGVDYFAYDLAREPVEDAFPGAGFLVHGAYVRHTASPDSDRINVDGARALLALCRSHGVKPLFLSSFSAHEGATSHYGRMKLEVERVFDPGRDLILRPALVVGRGGLFGSLARFTADRQIIPLMGSGRQKLQTLAVADLCLVIERGLAKGICGTYRIAHPAPVTLRGILEALAARRGRKAHFVPIPMGLVLLACRVAEALGVRLPVDSDSVLGLKHSQVFDTAGDVAVFGVNPMPLKESLLAMKAPGS
jgi:nucleoside-diphosphate-sugar epimerase